MRKYITLIFFQSNIQKFQFIMTIKNYLIDQYKNSSKLKINHSYLIEQFHDYKKIFKKIEKIVKFGDYTLGSEVNF